VNIGSGETTKKNTMSELMKEGMIKSQWHAYWLVQYYQFFIDHGVREENLRLRAHEKEELAHYANSCFDIEYKFPSGWKEIHGNADRGDFDLQQHIKVSKTDLSYFDQDSKERVVPCVIEPSQGIDRAFLTFMFDAHFDDTERGNVVLKLHPSLSPIKVGVFPLVNKLDLEARKVFDSIRKDFVCQFDRSGSIGRRYARADEIGIPYCVTVDFGTLEDKAVTIRDRDSTHQIRVPLATLTETLGKLLRHTIPFDKAGTPIAAQQKNE
jgi:glycyl-tRNA synthetase